MQGLGASTLAFLAAAPAASCAVMINRPFSGSCVCQVCSSYLREDAHAGLVCLDQHMLAELCCVEPQCLVKGAALVVVEVHGDVDGQAEEAGPHLADGALQQAGLALQQGCQEVTVAALVLTPGLKVLKQRVELALGVALQVAVDGDVAPVADFLA